MKKIRFESLIIYEDDNLVVINKPPGISSLDERNGENESIIGLARKHDPNLQLCHRLDKDTSGALIISKNKETYKAISKLFKDRKIRKEYVAIVEGRHHFEEYEVNIPLGISARGKGKIDRREGKPAQTILNVDEVYRHFTAVRCRPITGRLHQIRLHLTAQNAPIAGDTSYGGSRPYLSQIKRNFNIGRGKEETPMIDRFALHAEKLIFELNEKKYELVAEMPKDIAVFQKLLRKFDSVDI